MDDPGDPADPAAVSLWERFDSIEEELAGLTGRMCRAESGIEEFRSDLDDFEALAKQLAATSTADATAPDDSTAEPVSREAEPVSREAETPPGHEAEALDMRVLVAWVRENLALVFQRRIPQTNAPHWCRQWWQHPEAILRFEALRRSWVVAVGEPGAAMANYLILLDQHLAVLMDEHGPFAGCAAGQHNPEGIAGYLGQEDPSEEVYLAIERATPGPEPPGGALNSPGHPAP